MTKSVEKSDFSNLKQALQVFQAVRLNATYRDLKSDPQYERIGAFFFEKLYAPEDFSFRDASIRKLQKILKGKVYKGMISAVSQVIELHDLTDRLDDLMVEGMLAAGVGVDMDMDQYQAVYRGLDNYDERVYQINLSTEVTRAFHRLSRKWIVAVSLKTIRTTAHVIGMGKIIDFIYEGYEGFRAVKSIDFFVDTVQEREMAWHNEIWSGFRP